MDENLFWKTLPHDHGADLESSEHPGAEIPRDRDKKTIELSWQ
jgi:hypothetical protein